MAKFFIDRPIFAIVLSIMITLGGLIAAFQLPVAQYPQIAPPTVVVNANYVGANADVVNQTVAQVIEQQVNGVEKMAFMSSTSTDAGSYSLTVQFEPEANGDIASVQTQNKVAQVNAGLPQDVQQTGVTTLKASQDMSLIVSLYSPDNSYSDVFLSNYANIYIMEDIKRVKGVGNIRSFGADYAMRVWVRPDKLSQYGLTINNVTAAIKEQNIQAPAGAIGKMPAPASQQFQYTANVKGRLVTPEEFENIILTARADGSEVRLKDVARVELGGKDYVVKSELNGHPSMAFAVQLTNDANALETISKVQDVLEKASQNFPPGVQYTAIVDNTKFVRESITEVAKTFAEALLLVLLVVFLFLQSWRATLIPMLAIPVSLIGTFGAFLLLGFSINTLTLFAMVLAIGLVVDDAIVVIEAVEHHMRYSGLSPLEATKQAMSEVSGPVVAIAFVLASVFIPVAFFGGTMGILYKQFALTIAVSMGLSAVVALSLTPALCTLLLKPYDPDAHGGALGRFFDRFNAWFDRVLEGYGLRVGKLIRRSRWCIAFLLVIMVCTGFLFKLVPTSFVPEEDQGYFITAVSLPSGSSLNRTEQVIHKLAEELRQQPGVDSTIGIIGFDLLSSGLKSNSGAIFIRLAPWSERQTPAAQVKSQIGQVFMKSAQFPEGTIIALNPPALPGLGNVGGFTLMLQDRTGHTDAELDALAKKFVAAARQRPEIGTVYSTLDINSPVYNFDVNRDKVKALGIPLSDVFTALQVNFGGSQVNDFNRFGRTFKVVLQADPEFRTEADSARFMFLKTSSGTMVPLDTLLQPKGSTAPALINRFNGYRSIQINGSAASGYSSGQALAALEEVAKEVVPAEYTYDWAGQSREEKVSSGRTPYLFTLALIFVFLCLAALYESWTVPYAVLLSVPTGIFGAFLIQYLRGATNIGYYISGLYKKFNLLMGVENSVYMQIGLVMLIGLAAKNAILIVEYAKVRVDKGMDPVTAAIEASKLRLRPIIMTSLAFIIGCLPLAMASGAGAAARNAMGSAVVGGMFTATAMGIFLIPVLFVVVERITNRLHKFERLLGRKKEDKLA